MARDPNTLRLWILTIFQLLILVTTSSTYRPLRKTEWNWLMRRMAEGKGEWKAGGGAPGQMGLLKNTQNTPSVEHLRSGFQANVISLVQIDSEIFSAGLDILRSKIAIQISDLAALIRVSGDKEKVTPLLV